MMRSVMLTLLLPVAAQAQEAVWTFHWQGNGGYEIRGGMSYDPRGLDGPLVVEGDLACFFVEGLKDGAPVGHWGLGMLTEETDWLLTFDPASAQFLVYGMGVDMPQAWNMDGFGTSCGKGGFGFNIGNAAQDLCLDGELLRDSQVDPLRPFPAERAPDLQFPGYACIGPELLSALP